MIDQLCGDDEYGKILAATAECECRSYFSSATQLRWDEICEIKEKCDCFNALLFCIDTRDASHS